MLVEPIQDSILGTSESVLGTLGLLYRCREILPGLWKEIEHIDIFIFLERVRGRSIDWEDIATKLNDIINPWIKAGKK